MPTRENTDDAGAAQGVLLALTAGMPALAISSALPIVPSVRQAFQGQPGIDMLASLVVVAPTLALALAGPFAGSLGDKVGRRRLLNISMLVFAVFAILPYWLEDVRLIVASRAAAGIALAGVAASAVALTGDYFTGRVREKWLAVQVAANSIAGMIVAAAAGALAEIQWRLPFLMMAAAFALGVGLILVRAPAAFARSSTPQEDAGAEDAPVQLRSFTFVFSLGVIAAVVTYPPVFQLGILLEEKGLGSPMLTGFATAVLAGGGVVGASGIGLLARLAPLAKLGVAFLACAVGMAIMGAATSFLHVLIAAVAVGVGQGLTLPVLINRILEKAPAQQRGRVVGMFQSTFFLGIFASPLLAQALAQNVGGVANGMFGYATISLVIGIAGLVFGARFASKRLAS